MSDLSRWTGGLDTGAFRFGPEAEGEWVGLKLRSEGDWLCDAAGRRFCTLRELAEAGDSSWRGCPAFVIQRQVSSPDRPPWDAPTEALWIDARGIDTPESFRARLLGD